MKGKSILSTLALLLLYCTLRSQVYWDWSRSAGTGLNLEAGAAGNELAFDATGNLYMAGAMSTPAVLGTLSMPSFGQNDALIAKYDPMGNPIWAKTIGGIYNDAAKSVVVGPDGSVYVAGFFEGSGNFDGQVLQHFFYSFFVAKLDSGGNYIWIRDGNASGLGNTNSDPIIALACDQLGHLYVTSYCNQNSQLIDTTYVGNPGHTALYLTQLDAATGTMNWIHFKQGGTTGASIGNTGMEIAIDAQGNAVLAASLVRVDTVTNGSGSLTVYDNLVVGKYDAGGNVLWEREYGDTSLYVWGGHPKDIALDATGAIHVAGTFYKYFLLAPPTTAVTGGFTAKLDPADGDVLQARPYVSSNGSVPYIATCDYDGNGHIRNAGTICGTVDMGGVSLTPISTIYDCDNFVASYDTSGTLDWAVRYGYEDFESVRGSALRGNRYAIAGAFNDSIEFSGNVLRGDYFNTYASYAFVACEVIGDLVGGVGEPQAGLQLQLFPNPATTHVAIRADRDLGEYAVDIFAAGGGLAIADAPVVGGRIDVAALPAGAYYLRLRSADLALLQRFVKVE